MFRRKREREQYRLAVRNLQDQVELLHAQLVAASREFERRYAELKAAK
jgi:hypothetical protein